MRPPESGAGSLSVVLTLILALNIKKKPYEGSFSTTVARGQDEAPPTPVFD